MIVSRIEEYLESGKMGADQAVLDNYAATMRKSVERQFAQEREEKPGHIYCTLATKPCARQAAYTYLGFKPEPLQARARVNFFLGDAVEGAVLALARLANCPIESNNIKLLVTHEGIPPISVRPDGLYAGPEGHYNVEIKKMSSFGFDRFVEEGPDDSFGYLTQATVECEGWRQNGVHVRGTIFIACRSETGHLAEFVTLSDQDKLEAFYDRLKQAIASSPDSLPDRAFEPVPEKRGPKKTGRMVLPFNCSYCSMRDHCWPQATIETTSTGKPVWVIHKEIAHE